MDTSIQWDEIEQRLNQETTETVLFIIREKIIKSNYFIVLLASPKR